MSVVHDILNLLEGYLISIKRNTVDGWYELEVGLPAKWVYDENNQIKCEVVANDKEYTLLKIMPKNQKVTVDDLINFFHIVIETNEKIARKEEEFKNRMEKIKKDLEGEAKKFYEELDSLKENSFKNVNEDFVKKLQKTKQSDSNKRGRGRPPKTEKNEIKKKNPIIITDSEDDDEAKTTNV